MHSQECHSARAVAFAVAMVLASAVAALLAMTRNSCSWLRLDAALLINLFVNLLLFLEFVRELLV